MKKSNFIVLILLLVFIYFFYEHFTDEAQVIALFSQIKPLYLFAAITLQLLSYFFLVISLQIAFEVNGILWERKSLFFNIFSAFAIGLVTPLGSTVGMGIFVRDARKYNIPTISVITSIFLQTLSAFLTLLIFLTGSMVLLYYKGILMSYETTAYLIFFAIILLMAILLNIGLIAPWLIRVLLLIFKAIVNFFLKVFRSGKLLSSAWVEFKSNELITVSRTMYQEIGTFPRIMKYSILSFICSLGVFAMVFLGFNKILTPVQLLAGLSFNQLYTVVSPTPQGIGIVESIQPYTLTTLGIDNATAIVTTLVFRGITVWIPALIGFILIAVKSIFYKENVVQELTEETENN